VNRDIEAQVRAEIDDAKGKYRGGGDLPSQAIPTFDRFEKEFWGMSEQSEDERVELIVALRAIRESTLSVARLRRRDIRDAG